MTELSGLTQLGYVRASRRLGPSAWWGRLATGAGAAMIAVAMPQPSDADPWFADPISIALTRQPRVLGVGHFNEDVYGDVVVGVATGETEEAQIFLGDATGQLTLDATLPINYTWYRIAVGDFNGDGRDDIAVSERPSKVFYADGNHEYPGPAVTVPNGLNSVSYYWQMEAADIDSDGYCDLVGTLPASPPLNKFYINWGSPTGLSPGPTILELNMIDDIECFWWDFSSIYQYDLADMDADGDIDISFTGSYEYPGLCGVRRRGLGIWHSVGSRLFAPAPQWILKEDVAGSERFFSPAAVSLGTDADMDIVFGSNAEDSLLVVRGQGGLQWGTPEILDMLWSAHRWETIDSDDLVDAIVAYGPNTWVFQGHADGSMLNVQGIHTVMWDPEFQDVDADGDQDLIGTDPTAHLLHYVENLTPNVASNDGPDRRATREMRVVPSVTHNGPVRISWLAGSEAVDRCSIFDSAGRRLWVSGRLEGTTSVVWPLIDERGNEVASGSYWARGSATMTPVRILVVR